ncbi:helix-turn-helix domain-containing protein [Christiangramia aquimixticola]|uniref:helix-turn-helix domain-containing protein n=1 Tax=Christiangramia aquimixticola TaxID=1697558 RepID=UPI003AA92E02
MEGVKLHIKNVVCQRCIMSIEAILDRLNIAFSEVNLGEAVLERELNQQELEQLRLELEKIGFEIIENRDQKLINSIKSLIIKEVYSSRPSNQKLSSLLSNNLNYDYSHITHMFTESEGQSIQNFYNGIRIERVKEMLQQEENTIAMIADELGFSTPAYLSTSFKKATGFTPSHYKNLHIKDRKTLDSV